MGSTTTGQLVVVPPLPEARNEAREGTTAASNKSTSLVELFDAGILLGVAAIFS